MVEIAAPAFDIVQQLVPAAQEVDQREPRAEQIGPLGAMTNGSDRDAGAGSLPRARRDELRPIDLREAGVLRGRLGGRQ